MIVASTVLRQCVVLDDSLNGCLRGGCWWHCGNGGFAVCYFYMGVVEVRGHSEGIELCCP